MSLAYSYIEKIWQLTVGMHFHLSTESKISGDPAENVVSQGVLSGRATCDRTQEDVTGHRTHRCLAGP